MTSHSVHFPAVSALCAHVKRLGYGMSKHIRLYGEEFEVVSDPFPEANGVCGTRYDKKGFIRSCPADSRDSASECTKGGDSTSAHPG
jgi:hypothetical protein